MRTSLSLRRAWIEISTGISRTQSSGKSLSLRRAWIEISLKNPEGPPLRSLSLRRAWIEIKLIDYLDDGWKVALLTESVD